MQGRDSGAWASVQVGMGRSSQGDPDWGRSDGSKLRSVPRAFLRDVTQQADALKRLDAVAEAGDEVLEDALAIQRQQLADPILEPAADQRGRQRTERRM